ncbi:MAG TPA: flagellar hook-length control protein FliK [Xanthobacteraceae bacterium]|nr:flagellar hook-length control protein FliK [Xanthobacteraceae bacterium]
MAISLNPIFPVIAAQGVPADVVLQPGTVIDAQVLKLLANNAVRIAIANLSIEVMSEVPLQVGQNVRLAVSQTPDGIRLAIVGQQPSSASAPSLAPSDTVAIGSDMPVNAAAKAAATTPLPQQGLTALQALAVSAAAQSAATRQAGLSQLFADVQAAALSGNLPADLRQAAAQLLVGRPVLDASLSANDIKTALQNSGLFLEQRLAAGTMTPASSGMIHDLKAALLVFRQMLSLRLDSSGTGGKSAPAPGAAPQSSAGPDAAAAFARLGASAAPTLAPDLDVQEILLPQARVPAADDVARLGGGRFTFASGAAQPPLDAVAARLALNLLQETPAGGALHAAAATAEGDDVSVRTNVPPPPVRGASPTAQPIAVSSLASGASASEVMHRLHDDTDAAIARTTLLQIASLPDRADALAARNDSTAPRWHFEIPFATPAGTAVAQFEIARDGGGVEVEAAKRVWRARFSLDVEPAGPVHALVSLSGDTTSVRMWAERPATADQLRAGAAQLNEALSRADLKPGDIVIRDGAPPQTAAAPAGHFLDRAL